MDFKLPDPGEGIHEAEILEVRIAPGDTVKDGQIVLVIETDKAAVEIPAPRDGTIENIAVAAGDIVEVGATLFSYQGTEAKRADPESDDAEERNDGKQDQDEKRERDKEQAKDEEKKPNRKCRGQQSAPKSGRNEDEAHGGSDEDERAEHHPSTSSAEKQDESTTDDGTHRRAKRSANDVPASPATRKLARELGVDLVQLADADGAARVTEEDVRRAAQDRDGGNGARDRDDLVHRETDQDVEVERVKLRSIRRTVAKRMQKAWREIPHVTHTIALDITNIEAFRRRAAEDIEGLTLTVMICKALGSALVRHPRFNARLDTERDEIVLYKLQHIGVAVDTDSGLVVPVLRDVSRRSLTTLADDLTVLTDKARAGKLAPADLKDGTFTVTNMGAAGGEHFTPIINYPQSAILGIAAATERPCRANDVSIDWRLMLPLVLAFDHRLNDGMDAARFLHTLAGTLASPHAFLAAV